MANPTWPTTLPQYVLEGGYSERVQNQITETEMETGPAKIRRRFTKSLRRFEMQMMMTQAQAVAFETFWQTTCKGGSIPFDWKSPRSQAAATFRFRNPAPAFSVTGGTTVVVQFAVEQL